MKYPSWVILERSNGIRGLDQSKKYKTSRIGHTNTGSFILFRLVVAIIFDCFQIFGLAEGKGCLQWEKRKNFQILNPNVEL